MTEAGSTSMVRMGELVVSKAGEDVLVALGLGSCIGLALIDPRRRVAGLAHIVLPTGRTADADGGPARFADRAVPRLIERLRELGGLPTRLVAILAGGAQMFALGDNLDVGRRNEQATLAALAVARVPVRAAATGGAVGRTLRVHVGSGRVDVREAGRTPVVLHEGHG